MAGLPEGLVTNSETITQEIDSIDHVDVEDVIKLWKAYSTNKALFADGAGRRLENFFWRIWSGRDILDTITGGQVALLFNAISEEGPLRTTPTQSPRASRHLGTHRTSQYLPTDTLDARTRTPTGNGHHSSIKSLENQKGKGRLEENQSPSDQSISTQVSRYQGNFGSGAPKADASRYGIISEDDGDDSTPTPTPPSTLRSNEPAKEHAQNTGASDSSPRSEIMRADSQTILLGSVESSSTLNSVSSQDTVKAGQENTRRPVRKRAVVAAHTPANRRRPVTMRRKSSQTQASRAQSVKTPLTSESAPRRDEHPASAIRSIEQPMHAPSETSTKSSSHAGQDSSSHQRHGALVVEPDFRNEFVAKTRSAQSSFVSLPSLLRIPSSTTATSASYQASGTMDSSQQTQPAGRVRNRVTFSDEVTTSDRPAPTKPTDVSNEEAQALPRTRSQLTMLLERDRLRAGGNERAEKHQKKPSP